MTMNEASGPVAIIGTGGLNASAWTRALLSKGIKVRSLVRRPEEHRSTAYQEFVYFDLEQVSSHEVALAGVESVALVTPANLCQVANELRVIRAAIHSRVKRIVKLSVLGAELPHPISFFARSAADVERALRDSAVNCVILRSNAFMQNTLLQRKSIAAGRYVEPQGLPPCSFIDVEDIAEVAVKACSGELDGQVLTLSGKAALSGRDIALAYEVALGHKVDLSVLPLSEYKDMLSGAGLPEWRSGALMELYDNLLKQKGSHLSQVGADLTPIIGRPARSFDQFVRSNIAALSIN
ncbi:NmrA family NAD(P)-binding protein [Bradyrhizobium japonicum]|uniref:NmrA family NAD(P)-binding protein n=2 Tax=Nitrobacteraceae TaxID=41294 RepID=UPI0009B63AC9|nr:NmrA family NAD(P)-binding protein [Bradyrhizobium japonicum]